MFEGNPFEIKPALDLEKEWLQREARITSKALEAAWPELEAIRSEHLEKYGFEQEDGKTILFLRFKPEAEKLPSWVFREFNEKLKVILDKYGLTLGSEIYSEEFWVRAKSIEGKTNWRRWLPRWEAFSPKQQELLDELSSEIGEPQGSWDKFEAFSHFLKDGFKKGLLTEKEYDDLYGMMYKVAN